MQTCRIGLAERRSYASDFIYPKAYRKNFTYSAMAGSGLYRCMRQIQKKRRQKQRNWQC